MLDITVEELWREGLPSGTTLVGGSEGLGRTVSGTATMRARTPAFPPFHGGELALISLRLLAQVDLHARPDRLIHQLADARVAAIIFLDAGGDSASASATRDAADLLGIPVFACPPGASAESVDAALHRALAGRRETMLRRVQELQQEFTSLAFAGHGVPAIVERLAHVTGLPAVWEDRDLELRAWSAPPSANGALAALSQLAADLPTAVRGARLPLLRWAKERSTVGGTGGRSADVVVLPMQADPSPSAASWKRLLVTFGAGGDVTGYLSLLGRNGSISPDARLALSSAGLAASIEALRSTTVAEAHGKASTGVVRDWVTGRFRSKQELEAQLAHIGHTPAAPYGVILMEGTIPNELAARIAGTLSPATAASDPPRAAPLTCVMDELRTVLVVPDVDPAAFATAADAIHSLLAAADGDPPSSVQRDGEAFAGIGRVASAVQDVPSAYRDALQAMAIARRLGGRHRVAFFGTLGVYRLLTAVQPEAELRQFYDDMIGPLLAHDKKTHGDLMRTLDAYLTAGGSVVETADKLHTHRNTVLYRIVRIIEILKIDVRQAEHRLDLHLALRAGEVLGVVERTSGESALEELTALELKLPA